MNNAMLLKTKSGRMLLLITTLLSQKAEGLVIKNRLLVRV